MFKRLVDSVVHGFGFSAGKALFDEAVEKAEGALREPTEEEREKAKKEAREALARRGEGARRRGEEGREGAKEGRGRD